MVSHSGAKPLVTTDKDMPAKSLKRPGWHASIQIIRLISA